jgi:hypothetical protein
LSRNPPSGKVANEPSLSPCLITFARMFPRVARSHCWNAAVACWPKTPKPYAKFRFRTRSNTVSDFSTRWLIKSSLARAIAPGERLPTRRQMKPEKMFGKDDFWEHAIQDQRDYDTHLDYIHFKPVKHGWVPRVADWPHSSFHRFCGSRGRVTASDDPGVPRNRHLYRDRPASARLRNVCWPDRSR